MYLIDAALKGFLPAKMAYYATRGHGVQTLNIGKWADSAGVGRLCPHRPASSVGILGAGNQWKECFFGLFNGIALFDQCTCYHPTLPHTHPGAIFRGRDLSG